MGVVKWLAPSEAKLTHSSGTGGSIVSASEGEW